MKKLLIVVILLGLIGLFWGYKMWNKPHENISEQKVAFTVSANNVLGEFEKNEADANTKYINKIIKVTGKVSNIESNDSTSIVTLETDNPMSGVICELDPYSKHPRTNFQVGESIAFKGYCTGFLSDVIISRCVEVK